MWKNPQKYLFFEYFRVGANYSTTVAAKIPAETTATAAAATAPTTSAHNLKSVRFQKLKSSIHA